MSKFPLGQAPWVGLACLLALLSSATMVAGQTNPMAAADRAWADGDYRAALDGYEGALRGGALSGMELARALRMVGVFRSISEDMEGAQRAFGRAFALDPAQATPSELPPERLQAFNAARAANRGPMQLNLRAESSPDGSVLVTPTLLRAPAGWVEQLVVTVAEGGEQVWRGERAVVGPITVPASVSTGHDLTIEAHVRDSFGNILLVAQASARGGLISRGTPMSEQERLDLALAEQDDDDGGGVLASPVFWVVVGLAVAGGVVAAVLLSTGDTTYTLGQPTFER